MATMNISLPDQMKNWVEESVQSGLYANASDYIRDLIRQDHQKMAALRQALIEGELSGKASPFNLETFIQSKKS